MKSAAKLVALTFHDILPEFVADPPGSDPFYRISTRDFQALLRALQDEGYAGVDSLQVLDWLRGAGDLPERAVLLSFDDGHASDSTYTLPLLDRYGFKGCFFITTGFVGQPGYVTAEQLHHLADAGMEIGAHGVNHRALSELKGAALREELVASKHFLETELGKPVLSMAAPGGFWNAEVLQAARDAGYEAVWLSEIGWVAQGADPLRLKRVVVKQPFVLERVLRLARGDAGAMRPLRLRQRAIGGMKRVLGVEGYERLKNSLRRGSGDR